MNHEELRQQVGRNIRDLRNKMGWTQEELSTRAKLNRSYLSGIEGGSRNISLSTLAVIAAALEVDVVELFNDAKEEYENA